MGTLADARVSADMVAARLHDQCTDWDGKALAETAETRTSIYCGDIRTILAERDRLRTNLRHWREECGKLHARLSLRDTFISEKGLWNEFAVTALPTRHEANDAGQTAPQESR